LLFALSLAAAMAEGLECPQVPAATIAALKAYVSMRYHFPAGRRLEVQDCKRAGPAGYTRIFMVSETLGQPFQGLFFLSPDLRVASQEPFDLSFDPQKAAAEAVREVVSESKGSDLPGTGPPNAQTLMVVFLDFQCEYCRDMADVISKQIIPKYGSDLRIVFRHYPLQAHSWARRAAEAAACVSLQGDEVFMGFHNAVFAAQGRITDTEVEAELAKLLGSVPRADAMRYKQCLAEGMGRHRLYRDVLAAKLVRVSATPTIFVNEWRQDGIGDPEALLRKIEETVRAQKRVAADVAPVGADNGLSRGARQ